MDKKHELWMGSTISKYAQIIAGSAPDAIVTLGVLFYILSHRAYSGHKYNWTQVPVQHMATIGQMGFARIRAALNWLEEQRMIVPGSKEKYQARWYNVVIRTLEERQKILLSTPKDVADGPVIELVFWSPSTATVEWQTVSSEYANSLLRCKYCSRFFDPTLGKHPQDSLTCVVCYVSGVVELNTPAHLVLEFDEYDWTAKKVNQFLADCTQHKTSFKTR